MSVSAEEIRKKAYEIKDQIIADRRTLHQIPEIGTDLPETCAYIGRRLDEMGIPWKKCGGPLPEQMTRDYMEAGFPRMERATGLTAVIGHGSPCILLRADIDALPVREDNDLEYRSVNGAGHICGHDSHGAMLLGAARILKDMEAKLKGTIKLLFQPGEETGVGASDGGKRCAGRFWLYYGGSSGHVRVHRRGGTRECAAPQPADGAGRGSPARRFCCPCVHGGSLA